MFLLCTVYNLEMKPLKTVKKNTKLSHCYINYEIAINLHGTVLAVIHLFLESYNPLFESNYIINVSLLIHTEMLVH